MISAYNKVAAISAEAKEEERLRPDAGGISKTPCILKPGHGLPDNRCVIAVMWRVILLLITSSYAKSSKLFLEGINTFILPNAITSFSLDGSIPTYARKGNFWLIERPPKLTAYSPTQWKNPGAEVTMEHCEKSSLYTSGKEFCKLCVFILIRVDIRLCLVSCVLSIIIVLCILYWQ